MDLLEELQTRVVIADGAMGTQILAAGVPLDRCFEELCVSQPELITRIHTAYLAAGARFIATNSFGANAVRLARFGLDRRVGELNWSAAQLAKSAAKGRDAGVAGSVGPLGTVAPDINRKRVFEDQIGALLDGGAQAILLETFQALDELLIAIEVKHSLHHCPVICCLTCDDSGALPDGTPLAAAFAALHSAGADVVGLNCTAHPRAMPALFEGLPNDPPLAAFPSAGLQHELSPEDFSQVALALADRGVRLIGGCCGTTPAHLAAFAETLRARSA